MAARARAVRDRRPRPAHGGPHVVPLRAGLSAAAAVPDAGRACGRCGEAARGAAARPRRAVGRLRPIRARAAEVARRQDALHGAEGRPVRPVPGGARRGLAGRGRRGAGGRGRLRAERPAAPPARRPVEGALRDLLGRGPEPRPGRRVDGAREDPPCRGATRRRRRLRASPRRGGRLARRDGAARVPAASRGLRPRGRHRRGATGGRGRGGAVGARRHGGRGPAPAAPSLPDPGRSPCARARLAPPARARGPRGAREPPDAPPLLGGVAHGDPRPPARGGREARAHGRARRRARARALRRRAAAGARGASSSTASSTRRACCARRSRSPSGTPRRREPTPRACPRRGWTCTVPCSP